MPITIPITELIQNTDSVLSMASNEGREIIIERSGREYVVILSMERYQELLEAAQAQTRKQFKEARHDVFEVTKDIPQEEIEYLVKGAIAESRRVGAGLDESHS